MATPVCHDENGGSYSLAQATVSPNYCHIKTRGNLFFSIYTTLKLTWNLGIKLSWDAKCLLILFDSYYLLILPFLLYFFQIILGTSDSKRYINHISIRRFLVHLFYNYQVDCFLKLHTNKIYNNKNILIIFY